MIDPEPSTLRVAHSIEADNMARGDMLLLNRGVWVKDLGGKVPLATVDDFIAEYLPKLPLENIQKT
jgi:hypothetical protein